MSGFVYTFAYLFCLQGAEGFKNARRGTTFAAQAAATAAAHVSHGVTVIRSLLWHS